MSGDIGSACSWRGKDSSDGIMDHRAQRLGAALLITASGLASGCDEEGGGPSSIAGGSGGAGGGGGTGATAAAGGSAGAGASADGGTDAGGAAAHQLLAYGFEDWAGNADATPGYPFGAWSDEQWDDHQARTAVVQSCDGWGPASGSHFFYGDWYAAADTCLSGDGGAPFIFIGSDFNAGNPAGFVFEGQLPHDQLYLAFQVRLGDGWRTNTNHCVKFIRPRWAGGGFADHYSNVIYYCGEANYFAAPGYDEGYWDGSFHLDDLGIDLADGQWHQFAAWEDISRLREQPAGPLQVKVWLDGHLLIERDVSVNAEYVADNGPVDFRTVNLLENFCGTDNDGPVTYGFDDLEVWDAVPPE